MARNKGPDVLLVAKQNKAGLAAVKKTELLLKKYTDNIHFDKSTAFKLRKRGTSIRGFKGEFIITLGGDGTFLLTAHRANVPILPVRLEGVGFLTTTEWKDFVKYIPRLFRKKYTIAERMRVKTTKMPHTKISQMLEKIHASDYPLALNEVTFARKRPSKLLNIEVKIDDSSIKMVGDGVMISTPTGSTAYNASAGGSIIDPKLHVFSIIPLYPFYSKIKPLVIPADKKVEITVTGGDCALIVDGHGGDYFKTNTKFTIEKGRPVRVIHFDEPRFFEKVSKKLFEN